MPRTSRYVIQFTEKSLCPKCSARVKLLCHQLGSMTARAAFYICFSCAHVSQVGVGPVPEEGLDGD
jgi:hypothetical protein